jgi:hypothetical protein
MRIVDATVKTDIGRFWLNLGRTQALAVASGHWDEKLTVEEDRDIVAAIGERPEFDEAARKAFMRGIERGADELMAHNRSMARRLLILHIASVQLKCEVRRAKRTVTRKTVDHDSQGRIRSMIEERVEI